MLASATVKQRIAELQAASLRRCDITVDAIVEELGKIAFADMRQLFNADGTYRRVHELPDSIAAALVGVKLDEDGRIIEFKLADKRSALVDLGREQNIFEEDNTIKAEVRSISDLEVARRLAFLLARGEQALIEEVDNPDVVD